MKCRSVACIWAASPPSHRVTAAAALSHPPTLYTGGSDGSIVWWNTSATGSNKKEIVPVAMLCGHAAPIADMGIRSGHCKHRRKMPPWVGSPSVLRPLPRNPRYVCVAYCFIDAIHLVDRQFLESSEGGEASTDKDPQYWKPSKCTVVVVDTFTLTIVQTIFHGNLSIGPLRFMAVVPPVEDMEKQSVLLGDSYAKLQRVQILKETNSDGVYGTPLHNLEMADWAEDSSEGLQVVAFATSGKVLAHIYTTYCIFRLVASGTTIGQISFSNDQLFHEEGSGQSNVIGGMFLESDDAMKMLETKDSIAENFAVRNNRGFAVVYRITYSDCIFHFEFLSVIPAVTHPINMRLSILFIQLSFYLLRIESICFRVEEPLLWKPHVTTWLLPHNRDNNLNLHQECQMLSEGRFFVDWIGSSTYPNETECVSTILAGNRLAGGPSFPRRTVILVTIFHNGDIEVVRFNVFLEGIESDSRSQVHEIDSNVSKQYFLGHTGAVLCLAAHRMVSAAKGWSLNRVLVSGSMDCTIRIWDLDSGNLITVMHDHVAPVSQIILPPPQTDHPWNDCFLSVGEDSCITLVSLETLHVERMFPGHPYCPAKVVWDGTRGYLACLCHNDSGISDSLDVLYIWDVKIGARERVLRGTASHSMFDHFCEGINTKSPSGGVLNGNTSASSLLLPLVEDANISQSHSKKLGKGVSSSNIFPSMANITEGNASLIHSTKGNSAKLYSLKSSILQNNKHPINCACPFPGIAALSFDLGWLMSLFQKHEIFKDGGEKQGNTHVNELGAELSTGDKQYINHVKEQRADKPSPRHMSTDGSILDASEVHGTSSDTAVNDDWIRSLEGCLLLFSLSFLHLWDVDLELDKLLMIEMKLKRPENLLLSSGLQGDRGSLTLTFPSLMATLELWKSSSEFSTIRSLTMVSLAQLMIRWSHCCSAASSALAAFYTWNFLEKVPDLKPPLLQAEESEILSWLESFEMQDWISCVGGTSQDAMTSHIIVAAALAIWYPSLFKPCLATLVVHPLMKLVMALNDKYSSTAAELLAEGMESTWKACIPAEIPRLIGDIFFQIEFVSGAPTDSSAQNPAIPPNIRGTLVGILLPSLATADILGFLNAIESQIWSTASDSPVHLVSLMTLIRVIRGSPRNLAQYLDKRDKSKSFGCKWTSRASESAWRSFRSGYCNFSFKLFIRWRGIADSFIEREARLDSAIGF
ncbi:transducin/WD40 repeat-like superfamily protein [Actinidia rufa]|uniref:Transducin/WD40 repeat-like superfamily protein n=1 Tax=Actinidia rufa TaxID=165716 RepID=A0A7J0FS04_9ERIC|nr:transducin/WD40 repeat-like superfamily protein [Actinidia rufa]